MRANSSERATRGERSRILLDAVSLAIGDTTYKNNCPRCNQAGSFGVTRTADTVLYKCHRATCGIEGSVYSNLYEDSNVVSIDGSKVPTDIGKFKPNPFTGRIHDTPAHIVKWLGEMYELHPIDIEEHGIKWEPKYNRLIFPIYDYYGRRVGYTVKATKKSIGWKGSKAINYREVNDKVGLHFPPRVAADGKTIVVVEGILDAIKVSPIHASCALLGCYMTPTMAAFLASHYDDMIIALDSNALAAARRIMDSYKGIFNKIKILYLHQDPKDTKFDKLEEALTN